ncbi:hypothetical protein CAPTEDRAFT_208572 [Capitella teleta]|uniref:Uncharacterized protein n=1 Tax=Capitella teleta TaxID=283909 RepID=R7TVT1_CAPTE|nr:hypothetical protein CAPTEDRAFT_208572 [Capitella teleta]|eukprot:ELT97697.1 hypothetical protein CAPTEDRAFT_208572 [Capitella teleta]
MPTEGEVERASRNRPYDFDCMGAPINDMALDWRVRTVAYAVLQAVQPVRADTAVFTSTYLAKVISFFSRARTGRAGETVFPLNPSCAMSEQSDGMVYDVADIADKRDRSADDIFNNADMKVDPYTMPTVDTIAKVIDDVVATITDVCAEEMRRPTVYALGRQMLASSKSGFASVAFNAVAISHLMQGHEDEVASGSNQEDVFVSYAYPRKAELAAGMVAVAWVRADHFDSTMPWGEDCAAVTGLTADEVQPIAMRMHRLTLELPAAPYEWKSAVAGFVGCSSLGEFLDMADTMSPYYNGECRRPPHPYLKWCTEGDVYYMKRNYMISRHNPVNVDDDDDVDI